MQILFLALNSILLLFTFIECRNFGRCELARELSKNGVQRTLISNYVCLAEAVSSLETSKVNNRTVTLLELGIFQIPNKEWCGKNSKIGGKCQLPCDKLTDPKVTDDIECAMKIQSQFGFKFWRRWNERCKSNDPSDPWKFLPNLINCGH
ncbi:unnamed protein product [Chironomus riparius]|uniref:lysozyme n=1 Tax=Chironomus riparius TaxID=315576 RepID=A0A9N9RLC1_9DIPT|nr:unnamed protein product [Chironomus riparius]